MLKQSLLWTLYVILFITVVNGDYDCVCNYAVEKAVYPDYAQTEKALGYLYEFDCKPQADVLSQSGQQDILPIQFEKKLGYITSAQTQIQICAGSPSSGDKIEITTTRPTTQTTTTIPTTQTTTTIPTTQTTTTIPTTQTTTTIPTTQTTTTRPTTQTTTTIPTTQTTTTIPTTQTTTTIPTTQTTTTIPTTQTTTTIPTTQTTTTIPTTKQTTTGRPTTTTTPKPTTTEYLYWSMTANVTGTPYQYVGIGYNILTANPDTEPDTGFLTTSRIFQLTSDPTSTVLEATYQSTRTCVPHTRAFLIHGSKAYQDELMNYVFPANHTPSLTDASFTYNKNFKEREPLVNNVAHVYNDVITTCKFGTVNYNYNRNDIDITVSREFASAVCKLPQDYNTGKHEYMAFLDKWGTSIVTSVDIGTRTIARYETTPTALYQHVKDVDPDMILDGGAYTGYESSVAIDTTKYQNSRAATSTVGTKHMVSLGTQQHQIPISSHSIPITKAFDTTYWKPIIAELEIEGYCKGGVYNSGLTPYANNVRTALSQYATYKSTEQGFAKATLLDRPYVQVPLTWPIGTYGMMKAAQGCPRGHTRWSEGWRKFDTEDSDAHNYFTPNVQSYLSGEFQSNNIMTRFCMKIVTRTSQYDGNWPKGSYCLLKNGPCPTGFGSGYIFWDNEDSSTNNGHGGTMPEGVYNDNTKIYFCCRNDGASHDKIFLPTDKPFVLMRYSNVCQSVNGMSVTEVSVRWDDEDTFNSSGHGGMYPAENGGGENTLLHFCYYRSTSGGAGTILVG